MDKYIVRNEETLVGIPASGFLGGGKFILAKRLAMRGRGILLGRRAKADVGAADDERGTIRFVLSRADR